MALTSAFSVHKFKAISAETESLYKHPFAVSNAAQEINTHVISMHRYMKDVVLAQDAKQLNVASAQVTAHEAEVLNNFRIIFDRFLGDKDKIHNVYHSFIAWRDIRNEVIGLKRDNHSDSAAAITKGKGARHVRLLTTQTQELVDFAANKAAEFYNRSQDDTQNSVILMTILGTVTSLLAFAIAVYIVRSQNYSSAEIKKRSYLIDQNIMIARLSLTGEIVEISNALCRYLDVVQQEMLGSPSHFFIIDDNYENQEDVISRHLKTGLQWVGEIKRISKTGVVHWAKMTILPELDDDYIVNGYTCIMQDLTSKKLSLTDNLTTLGNRRQYEETLVREFGLAKRNDTYLSLAIIDIDHFKKYNDNYGHPQGDVALAKVGKAILSCMRRPNDFTYRIGGEEFAVLFSSMDREDSRLFLDTIRKHVEDLGIPHEKSPVSEHMTISIGGATLNGAALESGEHLYIEADKALYLAKETRNQTVMGSVDQITEYTTDLPRTA